MIVYFHIDELARDAVVASALKNQLKSRNGKLVYGNRFTTDYLLRYQNIYDAIILPSLLHFYYAFPDSDSLPDNIFILQTEAIGQATGTLKRLNGKYFGDEPVKYDPWHKAVRGYLLWGDAHLNSFYEHHPEYLPKCKVVGHPRLSYLCKGPSRKFSKTSSDNQIVVGFVSRCNLINAFDSRTGLESVMSSMRYGIKDIPLYEGSPEKDVEDMFFTEVTDFRIMLQIMSSLDPTRFIVAVRPHPRENRVSWKRLALHMGIEIKISDWDQPFSHWISEVDHIVTPPSTSLYDIFFHGRRAIVIDRVSNRRADHILSQSDDRNQILEGICRPNSVEEIIEILEGNDIPPPPENVQKCLKEQVGSDIASRSISNILDAIYEFNIGLQPPRRNAFAILSCHLFNLALSELKELKANVTWRVEQSASFNLTLRRQLWIDRLVGKR